MTRRHGWSTPSPCSVTPSWCTSRVPGSGTCAPAARDGDRPAVRSGPSRLSSGGNGRWARSTVYSSGRSTATEASSALVGPPGIGKSRIVRELTSRAKAAGVEVFRDLLRIAHHRPSFPRRRRPAAIDDRHRRSRDAAARAARYGRAFREPTTRTCCCSMTCSASAIPRRRCPQIDPDARRRRLAAMVKAAALARTTPVVYVIEDAHWIDGDQRVHAGGVPHGHSADAIARRGHLPAGIRWRTCACAPVADDRARAARRVADAGVGRRAVGRGQVGRRACRVDRRACGRQSRSSPRRSSGTSASATCWSAAVAATCASIRSPTSTCRARCRR